MSRQADHRADFLRASVADFVRARHPSAEVVQLELRRIEGGLEAEAVVRVAARITTATRTRSRRLVVKWLRGATVREAEAYRALARRGTTVAPRCLGVVPAPPDGVLLFLEFVRPSAPWPWNDVEMSARVLETLAAMHRAPAGQPAPGADGWDYEGELGRSGSATIEILERIAPAAPPVIARSLAAVRRTVVNLPRLRAALLGCTRFGRVFVHGDVHSGNIILTGAPVRPRVTLVDWTRARVGSALEDVSSFTQSLGCWVPEVRRRHDSLLLRYLRAYGGKAHLDAEFRAFYWLAAASNALSGALCYRSWELHSTPADSPAHAAAAIAGTNLVRVIRRADAYWN